MNGALLLCGLLRVPFLNICGNWVGERKKREREVLGKILSFVEKETDCLMDGIKWNRGFHTLLTRLKETVYLFFIFIESSAESCKKVLEM